MGLLLDSRYTYPRLLWSYLDMPLFSGLLTAHCSNWGTWHSWNSYQQAIMKPATPFRIKHNSWIHAVIFQSYKYFSFCIIFKIVIFIKTALWTLLKYIQILRKSSIFIIHYIKIIFFYFSEKLLRNASIKLGFDEHTYFNLIITVYNFITLTMCAPIYGQS